MNPIKFESQKNGEIFEYHFYPKEGEFIIEKDEYFPTMEDFGRTGVKVRKHQSH